MDQLKDAKITWSLVGHSERRVVLKEEDEVRLRCSTFFAGGRSC